jgi:hypothetical protein
MMSFKAGLTQEYTWHVHLHDERGRERRGRTNMPITVVVIRKPRPEKVSDGAASFRSDGLFISRNLFLNIYLQ